MNCLRLALFLLISLRLASAGTVDTFAAANEAYNKRNFGDAIAGYEKLVRHGENRPEIFYNLGLAYEGSVNPARAVLNYERALLLSPGYADAQARRDTLGDAPTRWWENLSRFGHNLSFSLAVGAFWVIVLSLVAYGLGLGGTRHLWGTTAFLFLIVLGVAGASFWLRDYPLASPDRAIVLKSEKLRSNFTASSPSILALKPGQAVEITSVNGPWTECRLPDQTRGWVASPSVERVIPQS